MKTINVSLNPSQFFSFAFLGFLTILAVKLVIAVGALVVLPQLDGESFWAFAGLLAKMTSRWFLSLVVATVVALVVCLCGRSLKTALAACAVLGAIGSFL